MGYRENQCSKVTTYPLIRAKGYYHNPILLAIACFFCENIMKREGIMDEIGIWIVLYTMLVVAAVLFSAWFFRVVFRVNEIVPLLRIIAGIKDNDRRGESNMEIRIGEKKYAFEGPYYLRDAPQAIKDKPGVYVIHCESGSNNYTRLDVGKSDEGLHTRIVGHDRSDCWTRNCNGSITISVLYLDNQRDRDAWEQALRNERKLPCGDR